jgi:hypothetical protein
VLVKGIALGHKALDQFLELGLTLGAITSARKLLTNRSYGVSYHLCSG